MLLENDYNWEKIVIGAAKYDFLMKRFYEVDVSTDEKFQRKFTGFYRIRRSKDLFLIKYYDLMESLKQKQTTYSEILYKVYEFIGNIESSFSSKMLATLNPDMPVWDQYVLENIGIKPPNQNKKTIANCVELYAEIVEWYKRFINTSEARSMLQMFNEKLPMYKHFSDIKKIDLMLWQKRI